MNLSIALTALVALQGGSIDQHTQANLRDLSFTAHVKSGKQSELRKINDDFGQSYRFEYTNFKLKEPFKVRGETKVEDTDILFILNGGTRLFRAPRQRINIKQNVSMKPGMRQTVLDFGLVTPSLFDSFLDAKFVRNDRATGDLVYDLTYNPKFKDTTRYRVWIDPSKKFTAKREWYGQDGNLKATFYYSDPVSSGGCWIPTHYLVKNAEGHVAGETIYTNVKANSGLDDSLFAF